VTCVLIAAAIPCGLAGLITNYTGLLLIRFFVGIAGASFVPCLTWCTLFYDKVSIVCCLLRGESDLVLLL
jgi:NNP family nitrate/nitrite transporter-like MFS transporter